jgi:CO/xanthine dehydrogenase Mo-binding subunit
MAEHAVVGTRVKRQDAPKKLTGQERFTGDLRLPGMLYARPVGSAYAHAWIRGIDASAALAIPGVVAVLGAHDLPIGLDKNGNPHKTPIAFDEALYAGHIVAVVLADSDAAAQDGAAVVVVDYDPMPVISSIEQALDPASPSMREKVLAISEEEASIHNSDAAKKSEETHEQLPVNVSNTVFFHRGDVNAGFAEADAVVEYTLNSRWVHQGYMETQAAMATVDPLGKLTVYTSTQGAFHCRNRVAETVGLPLTDVNIVPMPVGGGFGGKFTLIEPLVAALTLAVDRPVLLQYTRMEDFLAGNPGPACRMHVKLGGKKDGTFTALQAQVDFDSGAAASSPLQIASILLGGYYRFPNLEIKGYEVLTNKAAAGAYRAPGAQQASLAIESAVDDLCLKLGLDPMRVRIQNCAVEGDPRPNGAAWPLIGLKETLEAMEQHPAWQNRAASKAQGRGVGVAVGGWPGGIEPATAVCRLEQNGTFTLVLGSVDLNGTNTTFGQIIAEELGVGADEINVVTAATETAPFAGGTGGSKITYTVGVAVKKAAEDARQQIFNIASQMLEAAPSDLEIQAGKVQVKGVPGTGVTLKQIAQSSMTIAGKYEPVLGQGGSAITVNAPGFAVHIAEVEIDDVTGETKITRYVAGQDVGFAINPALVEAQIEGAVGQGIGWALYEGMSFDDDGQLQTASFMDYTLPRASMMPKIEMVLVEVPSEHGAYGSKGIGEPPSVPGPGAIANAIRDAVGVRVGELPIRPEVLAGALWESDAAGD